MKMSAELLSHLKHVPARAYGNNLSMYSIALEGWRRGLTLKFFTAYYEEAFEIQYSLSNGDREHFFQISRGDKVSQDAIDICKNKNLTKKYLENAGVPTPKGKSFPGSAEDKEIIDYIDFIGFPVVIKPINGKLGRGVIINIQDKEQLKKALDEVRNKLSYKEVVVEKYIHGDDIRAYVIDGKVIGAIKRVPANIVGDGKHTILELIEIKNKERKNNPNLSTRPIKIDDEVIKFINSKGYTLESILEKNEKLRLRGVSNISKGGEPIDVTDNLPKKVSEIAVNSLKAIPGLPQGGVDLIVNEENNSVFVIEVNTRAGIGSHLFPIEGKARNVPKAIIDYYFPETKVLKTQDNFCFDFKKITDYLREGSIHETVISPLEGSDFDKHVYEVYGNVQTNSFKQWVKRQATNLNLSGFTKNIANGNLLIVVSGEKFKLEKFKQLIEEHCPLMNNVNPAFEKELLTPINIGFEIKTETLKLDGTKEKSQKGKAKHNLVKLKEKEKKKLQKELARVEKKYKKVINSKTWRYSAPLRQLTKLLKGI